MYAAAGRFAAVCCVRGGGVRRINSSLSVWTGEPASTCLCVPNPASTVVGPMCGPPLGTPPLIGRLSGVGALWDCVSRVCDGGGGCAGGGVPLGAVPVLSWCGEVSLGGIQSSSSMYGSPFGTPPLVAPLPSLSAPRLPMLSWCGEVSLGGIQSPSPLVLPLCSLCAPRLPVLVLCSFAPFSLLPLVLWTGEPLEVALEGQEAKKRRATWSQ